MNRRDVADDEAAAQGHAEGAGVDAAAGVVKLMEAKRPLVSRVGLVTLGIFVALVIGVVVHVFSAPTHMAVVSLAWVALPWIGLELLLRPEWEWLAFALGFYGGFLINLVLAYAVGAFIESLWRRRVRRVMQQRGAGT